MDDCDMTQDKDRMRVAGSACQWELCNEGASSGKRRRFGRERNRAREIEVWGNGRDKVTQEGG
jgi:hypothetical protein